MGFSQIEEKGMRKGSKWNRLIMVLKKAELCMFRTTSVRNLLREQKNNSEIGLNKNNKNNWETYE